jgi:hypothetical protein
VASGRPNQGWTSLLPSHLLVEVMAAPVVTRARTQFVRALETTGVTEGPTGSRLALCCDKICDLRPRENRDKHGGTRGAAHTPEMRGKGCTSGHVFVGTPTLRQG